MLSDHEFTAAILPHGYHVCGTAIDSLDDITDNMFTTGSIPVGKQRPWYDNLSDGDDRITDEFTAWFNRTCVATGVQPNSTEDKDMRLVLSHMAQQFIEHQGIEGVKGLYAIEAVLVGGASFAREHHRFPVDAAQFVSMWQNDPAAAVVLGYL